MNIEFFWTPESNRLLIFDLDTSEVRPLDPVGELSLCFQLDRKIQQIYPETWKKLCKLYGDNDCFVFARVQRFLKCNFSAHDHRPDIDDDENFDLEKVPCPMRGECTDGICSPKLTTDLSKREIQIANCFVEGLSFDEIGERLYISPRTVHNHMTNIYAKLRFTGRKNPDRLLINFIYKNGLLC